MIRIPCRPGFSPTCRPEGQPTTEPHYASRGFTLIEILVVLVIVGVMLALVSLNLAPDDGRILQTEGQRLALLLEQARDEAISSGQEIAWSSEKESYRFWRKDKKDEWVASSEDELFRERNWPPGVQLLEVRINRNPAPSNQRLVFSPAGLNAPFQLALGLGEQRIWVNGGGMGGMTIEKRQE